MVSANLDKSKADGGLAGHLYGVVQSGQAGFRKPSFFNVLQAGKFKNPFDLTASEITSPLDPLGLLQATINVLEGAHIGAFNSFIRSVWPMNDVGSPINDVVSGFDLSVIGAPTFGQTGKNVNSILIHDTVDYFNRPAGFGPTGSEQFAINVWFKPGTTPAGGIIWGFGDSTFRLLMNSSRVVSFIASGIAQTTIGTAIANDWNQLLSCRRTINGSNFYVFYLNGEEKLILADSQAHNLSLQPFYVGRQAAVADWAGGEIDEMTYWLDTGLSEVAAQDLWNNGDGLFLV